MQIFPSFGSIVGPSWPGIQILTTTCEGGVSKGDFASLNLGDHVGDDPLAVARNREFVGNALPGSPQWLRQVHGLDVVDADLSGCAIAPQADAAVSSQPCKVLAILTADCLPIVIASHNASVVAVAHAGWRGLAAGILEETLAQVRRKAGAEVALQAWIGPAIGPAAFEVGEDVVQAFSADGTQNAFIKRTGAPGKWLCNLPLLAASRLQRAGVASVEQCGICTVADSRFYSYRRSARTGRFATFAWLDGSGTTRASATAQAVGV